MEKKCLVNTQKRQRCVYLSSLSIAYGYELLSDYGQHLNVDAVEFVKTTPSTRLSESAEEASHHLEDSGYRHIKN